MKVYEMIQDLARYDADMEVEINIYAKEHSAYATVQEDAEDGEDVRVKIDFDEDVSDFSIEEYYDRFRSKKVKINVDLP